MYPHTQVFFFLLFRSFLAPLGPFPEACPLTCSAYDRIEFLHCLCSSVTPVVGPQSSLFSHHGHRARVDLDVDGRFRMRTDTLKTEPATRCEGLILTSLILLNTTIGEEGRTRSSTRTVSVSVTDHRRGVIYRSKRSIPPS